VYDRELIVEGVPAPELVIEDFNSGSWFLKGVFTTELDPDENQYTYTYGK